MKRWMGGASCTITIAWAPNHHRFIFDKAIKILPKFTENQFFLVFINGFYRLEQRRLHLIVLKTINQKIQF